MGRYVEPDSEMVALIRQEVARGDSFEEVAKRHCCFEKDVADAVSEGRRMPWAPRTEK